MLTVSAIEMVVCCTRNRNKYVPVKKTFAVVAKLHYKVNVREHSGSRRLYPRKYVQVRLFVLRPSNTTTPVVLFCTVNYVWASCMHVRSECHP